MPLSFVPRAMVALSVLAPLEACTSYLSDTRFDHGVDNKPLSELETQVWTDPEGCDHWIIDDGLEGYMTPRRHPDGTPVCRADAVPERIYNLVK